MVYKPLAQRRAEAEAKSNAKTDRFNDPRCGTVAGYLAHGRKKPRERACKECRQAWALYYRAYKKNKGANEWR